LFVALSNADFIQGWMSILQSHLVPLVGLYLLPMISQYIVQQMKLTAPNVLLCERLSSGLRQTYLNNGGLRMSRMVPIVGVKPSQMAYFYLVEIEKTRLYLLSQRFITDHTELQLVMPSLDAESENIAKSISQEQGMECTIVDTLSYAKNINIAPELVKEHPELLHMQLLANGHIPDNLAPEQLTKANQLYNIRQTLYLVTAMTVLLGISLIGYNFLMAKKEIAEKEQVIQQTYVQQKLYETVAKDFPDKPVSSDELKAIVEMSKDIERYNARTPEVVMVLLSHALHGMPEIGIQRIHWLQSANPNVTDVSTVSEAIEEDGIQGSPLLEVVFVTGEILEFNGDYRAALDSMNRFAVKLKQEQNVNEVAVLEEPVNVSSLVKLQGSTKDSNQSKEATVFFKLKVVLKPLDLQKGKV
jgi:hypothetical protein